jgi:hypothetical protein
VEEVEKMANKAYYPYLKTSLYGRYGKRTIEPLLEAKGGSTKAETSKQKILQTWKVRKGSLDKHTGRGQKTRKQVFKKSER